MEEKKTHTKTQVGSIVTSRVVPFFQASQQWWVWFLVVFFTSLSCQTICLSAWKVEEAHRELCQASGHVNRDALMGFSFIMIELGLLRLINMTKTACFALQGVLMEWNKFNIWRGIVWLYFPSIIEMLSRSSFTTKRTKGPWFHFVPCYRLRNMESVDAAKGINAMLLVSITNRLTEETEKEILNSTTPIGYAWANNRYQHFGACCT